MKSNRLRDYLDHIRTAAQDAEQFLAAMDKESFLADVRTQRAVVMCFIIIGEAAGKIMDKYPDFVRQHDTVPWRNMRGMRNRMAHGYFDINLDVVWTTVQTWLPQLRAQLDNIHNADN